MVIKNESINIKELIGSYFHVIGIILLLSFIISFLILPSIHVDRKYYSCNSRIAINRKKINTAILDYEVSNITVLNNKPDQCEISLYSVPGTQYYDIFLQGYDSYRCIDSLNEITESFTDYINKKYNYNSYIVSYSSIPKEVNDSYSKQYVLYEVLFGTFLIISSIYLIAFCFLQKQINVQLINLGCLLICVILLYVSFVGNIESDTVPTISLIGNRYISHSFEIDDYQEIISKVTAFDNEDGIIDSNIRLYTVEVSKEALKAIYIVRDSCDNLVTKSYCFIIN